MELSAESSGSTINIGRNLRLSSGSFPYAGDLTVSRRQLSLNLQNTHQSGPRVRFQVVGKNPILVLSRETGSALLWKCSEKGELGAGDRVSLSLKNPFFFSVEEIDSVGEEEEKENLSSEIESEMGAFDVSFIDPVKEFGFLVKGHEFDSYPKQKLKAVKDWNWYLDKDGEESDEEVVAGGIVKRQKGGRRGRKKRRGVGDDNDEEEWTGESDEEKVAASRVRIAKKQYATRSRDAKKPRKDNTTIKNYCRKGDFKEDEEDETLSGFIVDDQGDVDEEADEEEDELEEDYEDENDD